MSNLSLTELNLVAKIEALKAMKECLKINY